MSQSRARPDALPERISRQVRQPRLVTVHEAAEYFRVQEPTIRRWCRERRITAYRAGKSWLIPAGAAFSGEIESKPEDVASEVESASRNDSSIMSTDYGCHILMVADGDVGLSDVFAALDLQTERVTRLQVVRTRLQDPIRDLHVTPARKIHALLQQVEAARSQSNEIVALIDGNPHATFQTQDDISEWEHSLAQEAHDRRFSVICLYDAGWMRSHSMDVWAPSFASHDLVWLQGGSSGFSLVPGQTDMAIAA